MQIRHDFCSTPEISKSATIYIVVVFSTCVKAAKRLLTHTFKTLFAYQKIYEFGRAHGRQCTMELVRWRQCMPALRLQYSVGPGVQEEMESCKNIRE